MLRSIPFLSFEMFADVNTSKHHRNILYTLLFYGPRGLYLPPWYPRKQENPEDEHPGVLRMCPTPNLEGFKIHPSLGRHDLNSLLSADLPYTILYYRLRLFGRSVLCCHEDDLRRCWHRFR